MMTYIPAVTRLAFAVLVLSQTAPDGRRRYGYRRSEMASQQASRLRVLD